MELTLADSSGTRAIRNRSDVLVRLVARWHSPDNAGDAGKLLDWGFGGGRSARTGLRLPDYVRPASVAALLTRPSTEERRRLATASGAVIALLAAVALAVHRLRQRA